MKINQAFKEYIITPVAMSLILGGLYGCGQQRIHRKPQAILGTVSVYLQNGELDPEPYYIIDEDRDKKADIIIQYKELKFIAHGHRLQGAFLMDGVKTMSADLRNAATKALRTDQDLSSLLSN